MKCQTQVSGENNNNMNLSSAIIGPYKTLFQPKIIFVLLTSP